MEEKLTYLIKNLDYSGVLKEKTHSFEGMR